MRRLAYSPFSSLNSNRHACPLLGVEIQLPSQMPRRYQGPSCPEKRLMLAVLEGAVADAGRAPRPHRPPGSYHRENATVIMDPRVWIAEENYAWPYSFVNICEALGFEPSAFRKRLAQRWEAASEALRRRAREHVDGRHRQVA